MFKTAKFQFFKVKVSRFVRGTFRKVKNKFSDDRAGAASEMFNEEVRPSREVDREKKTKSTIMVLVAGTAIGISQAATISAKYRIKTSPKATLGMGVVIGVATAGIWYKWMDAAEDDIHEEDIDMVFDMMQHTSTRVFDVDLDRGNDKGEYFKHVDILHTIVTGKDNFDEKDDLKVEIPYEEDEDDKGDKKKSSENKIREEDRVFGKKASFEDEDRGASTSGGGNRFKPERSIGISKPLARKSFLPDLDREEADRKEQDQPKEGWLDFS